MKKLLIFACLYFIANLGYAQTSKEFDIKGFSSIKVEGIIEAQLIQGENESILIEAPSEIIDQVTVQQEGEKLVISIKDKILINNKKVVLSKKKDEFKITAVINFISMKEIETSGLSSIILNDTSLILENLSSLVASGVSSIDVKAPIHSKKMDVNVSGISKINFVGELHCNDLDLDVSGASSLDFRSLECKELKVETSGASNLKGTSIKGKEIKIKSSGSSSVHADIEAEDTTIDASGGSKVRLTGRTQNQKINKSGSASVDLKS